MIIIMQIIKNIKWFFTISLVIKESFNLIGWEAQQVATNQKSSK